MTEISSVADSSVTQAFIQKSSARPSLESKMMSSVTYVNPEEIAKITKAEVKSDHARTFL